MKATAPSSAPSGLAPHFAREQEEEQRAEEVVKEHPGHVRQRHDLLDQRQRPVGRVDERVVRAAREGRHAEEDERIPQRIDVVLPQRLLADPHETRGRGGVRRDEGLAAHRDLVEEQHRQKRENDGGPRGRERQGARRLRPGFRCGFLFRHRSACGRVSRGLQSRASISCTMRAASASQSWPRASAPPPGVAGSRERPVQAACPVVVRGREEEVGWAFLQVEDGRGDHREAGRQVLVDLVGVDPLHERIVGAKRNDADVERLHAGGHLRIGPRPQHRDALAPAELRDRARGRGRAGPYQYHRPPAPVPAQRLEHLEVEEVERSPT